ncbi:LysR family transcriptional regulator [Halobacteriovorax marinus]|uniref:LysR family transcriptional regulator n=1 Tax=Halobacteriovorax marinus (strain ATCC BAA-682 / DSM 15412 / SJ) TaxID=862908 RepID=E1X368_HALMS|nr:LysR family transcriptional regulator [Halobacteriovorax marinus]ATH08230.1 LysR family transcriptional regulator [Halobacteriovorax marinus]CBW26898.1 putative LysR family transcriptional regulator [Halobacteriovorax marinus SJ]
MIETSQLQTLVAVARAKSFSKAAEDLNVTQSAISQSIKNLENKIEVKLFKRSGKKVVLTPEGEKLFSLASSFLGNLGDTLEEIQNDKESMSGKVRIGTLTGVGKSWLAHEMLEYAKKWDDLTVQITLGFQEDLVRAFESYQLDFLILPEESLPSVGEKTLLSEEMSTVVYPKDCDFDIDPENITLEDISTLPTILFEQEDHLLQKWCKDIFGKFPKKFNVRYIINSHGNMLQAVQQGMGLAVVPKHVLNRSFFKDKLNTLGEKFEVSNGKFYIVYHKGSEELLRIQSTLAMLTNSENPLN